MYMYVCMYMYCKYCIVVQLLAVVLRILTEANDIFL